MIVLVIGEAMAARQRNNRMTYRQRALYDYLRDRQIQGLPVPTYREMMRAMGNASPAPIQALIEKLVYKGWVLRTPGQARSLRVVMPDIQMMPVPAKHVEMVKEFIEGLEDD